MSLKAHQSKQNIVLLVSSTYEAISQVVGPTVRSLAVLYVYE